MKIVHSFWSKPALSKTGSLEKFNGGWRHPKYHLMSWALSCLSFKKYYGKIELVTDRAGKELLVDQLQLPYTSVKTELNTLDKYPEQLWAIGKLYAYSIQKEPFIHVDGDTYIWERFSPQIENATLVAQHIDINADHYAQALDQLNTLNFEIPDFLRNDYILAKEFNAINAGIIGGNNFEFFKNYSAQAFEFIDKNINLVEPNLKGDLYALIYEQYLFSAMARRENFMIEPLLNHKILSVFDLTNFMNKYGIIKYVHLLSNMKCFLENCQILEHLLLLEYPEFHKRISNLTTTNHG